MSYPSMVGRVWGIGVDQGWQAFACVSQVRLLAEELAAYDKDFETAKIWVGKQAFRWSGPSLRLF